MNASRMVGAAALLCTLAAGCKDGATGAKPAPSGSPVPIAATETFRGRAPAPLTTDDRRIRSDEDCRQARVCAESGACTHRQGRCVASTDEDCARSRWCERVGNCKAHDGLCVVAAATSADCDKPHGTARRNPCTISGQCTARDGVCFAASDADCGRSQACADRGGCSARAGRCVATSGEDCKKSVACKQGGRCKFKKENDDGTGICVAEEPKDDGHGHGHGHQHGRP